MLILMIRMKCGASQSKKTKTETGWIDRFAQEVLGFSVGSRGKKPFKEQIRQIEKVSVGQYALATGKVSSHTLQRRDGLEKIVTSNRKSECECSTLSCSIFEKDTLLFKVSNHGGIIAFSAVF